MTIFDVLARWLIKKSGTLRYAAKQYHEQLQRTREFEDSIRLMLECPETQRWAIRVWNSVPHEHKSFYQALYVDKAWAVILGRDIADRIKITEKTNIGA